MAPRPTARMTVNSQDSHPAGMSSSAAQPSTDLREARRPRNRSRSIGTGANRGRSERSLGTSTMDEVRRALLGSWTLMSWEEIRADGSIDYPLGADARGLLMYDDSGRVSVQLVRPHKAGFASDDWCQARPGEMASAWPNYVGYFGTFRIDVEDNAVIHEIEGGWFPNLEGTDQLRRFQLRGDRLDLDADTAWGHVRIVWKKADG